MEFVKGLFSKIGTEDDTEEIAKFYIDYANFYIVDYWNENRKIFKQDKINICNDINEKFEEFLSTLTDLIAKNDNINSNFDLIIQNFAEGYNLLYDAFEVVNYLKKEFYNREYNEMQDLFCMIDTFKKKIQNQKDSYFQEIIILKYDCNNRIMLGYEPERKGEFTILLSTETSYYKNIFEIRKIIFQKKKEEIYKDFEYLKRTFKSAFERKSQKIIKEIKKSKSIDKFLAFKDSLKIPSQMKEIIDFFTELKDFACKSKIEFPKEDLSKAIINLERNYTHGTEKDFTAKEVFDFLMKELLLNPIEEIENQYNEILDFEKEYKRLFLSYTELAVSKVIPS